MTATCRSCRAPIMWCETEATDKKPAKRMPLDASKEGDPLVIPNGNIAIEAGRRLAARPEPPAPGLVLWGSDCVLDGGCGGNATPGSMRCDDCKSDQHTVALWKQAT